MTGINSLKKANFAPGSRIAASSDMVIITCFSYEAIAESPTGLFMLELSQDSNADWMPRSLLRNYALLLLCTIILRADIDTTGVDR